MLNFIAVQGLAKDILIAGGRAYLVGGFVRDREMGLQSKDFDLEVFGLEVSKLVGILQRFADSYREKLNLVGESFQVYKIGLNLDVSIPRKDRKIGEGHKGFEITGHPFLSTVEAARRRDFTMNSMFLDPLSGEIIDHFEGRKHIQEKRICVTDAVTFIEDPLRVLRAVQFASRFGFAISEFTKNVIKGESVYGDMDLKELPRERVWMEFEKWLMLSPKPSVGLFLMQELGILDKLFPELEKLVGVPQDARHHPEGDVFVHTALALDVAKTAVAELPYPEQVTVMLATLCHDLGKFETTQSWAVHTDGGLCEVGSPACDGYNLTDEIRITAHGHAEAGVSLARNILDRLALHSIEGYDVRGQVLALVENHLAPFAFHRQPPKDSAFRRLATKVDLNLLHKVCHADAYSRNGNTVGKVFGTEAQDWFLEKISNLAIPSKGPEKLLLGRHLLEIGMKPGKEMGEVVAAVFEQQLEGTVTNLEEAKMAASKILHDSDYFTRLEKNANSKTSLEA